MLRKAIYSLLPVLACAGVTPGQAAPRTATTTVSVAVAKQCTFGVAPSMHPAATAAGGNKVITMSGTNSWSWTVRCNAPARISLSATALQTGVGGAGKVANFTTTVSNWKAAPDTLTTNANASGNTNSLIAIKDFDTASAVSGPVIFSAGSPVATGNTNFTAGTYTGLITVSLSAL